MGSEQHSRKLNLYLRHRAELIDYATPIVGDRALAEDVVQDAWLRFSEAGSHDAKTRLIRQPVGYLYRIVRNLALDRSEEHTSELQSLMRISYAVFCLKKKTLNKTVTTQSIKNTTN